jgi:NADP-dependent 3-hydroxy acid dehydrogenase YdfG
MTSPRNMPSTGPPVAIVTGASGGFGVGIARALVGEGYRVFATARSEDRLRRAAAEVGAEPVVADATRGADWDRLFATVLDAAGRVDLLVNNAGAGGRVADVVELTDEEIFACVQLNLTGVILGCRRAAPVLRRQGGGTIVNISSVCARYSWPGWSVYSAAKAGVERFGKGLYAELRGSGVRVTTLTPSWGATDFADASGIGNHPSTLPGTRERCIHPDELGRIVADIARAPAHLEILELTVLPTVQEIIPL